MSCAASEPPRAFAFVMATVNWFQRSFDALMPPEQMSFPATPLLSPSNFMLQSAEVDQRFRKVIFAAALVMSEERTRSPSTFGRISNDVQLAST